MFPLLALVCPYIFLLFDCFEWALIDCIEKHRVDSVLWQFQMGGSIGRFTLNLPFPYIFLLFDCFEWALIDRIEKCRVHSAVWQFRMGGGGSIGRFTLNLPDLSSMECVCKITKSRVKFSLFIY